MRYALALGALAVLLGTPTAASADPDNANTFPLHLSCSNGHDYTITVLANAPETAAVHVVDSPSVLVPTTFAFHTLVTADNSGAVLDESSTSAMAVHGRSGEHLGTFSCVFAQFAHHVWPDVGAVTIEVDGTVEAYVPH